MSKENYRRLGDYIREVDVRIGIWEPRNFETASTAMKRGLQTQ